jgi:hypothetical protein
LFSLFGADLAIMQAASWLGCFFADIIYDMIYPIRKNFDSGMGDLPSYMQLWNLTAARAPSGSQITSSRRNVFEFFFPKQ